MATSEAMALGEYNLEWCHRMMTATGTTDDIMRVSLFNIAHYCTHVERKIVPHVLTELRCEVHEDGHPFQFFTTWFVRAVAALHLWAHSKYTRVPSEDDVLAHATPDFYAHWRRVLLDQQ